MFADMKEIEHTKASLTSDLLHLGVQAGMTLIVHTSLRAIGRGKGCPVSVIRVLEDAARDQGTIVMPAMTLNLCDPSEEENLHPEDQWETVRSAMPLYDPNRSPTTSMGVVEETFRKRTGGLRSSHPHCSFAAGGWAGKTGCRASRAGLRVGRAIANREAV